MGQDSERRAENQALRREANERIVEVMAHMEGVELAPIEIICECGDEACRSLLPMDQADYARIRADGDLYVLARGHEEPTFERMVRYVDGYVVVERRSESATRLSS
jgi:hypothetical protein